MSFVDRSKEMVAKMERILVVEDSKMFANVVRKQIESQLGFNCTIASTFEETRGLLQDGKGNFFMAIVDLNLPDAREEEVVEYIIGKGIPVIVFTANFSDDVRERILSRNVVDYVLKEGTQDVDYLVHTIRRVYKNQSVKVLVVEDSNVTRAFIRSMLETHKFQVIEANNGKDGLKILFQDLEIKLVIVDYNMPNMDGYEFVSRVRKKFKSDQMAVIGISAHGSALLSAKFLKKGANDFINKPFFKEEFYCRINQNIEMLEHIAAIHEASNRDYLTGLYNRRYFFELGQKIYENAKRGNLQMTMAMIDIDHFKQINDSYGHDAGDRALRKVADIISGSVRASDVVARFGGEEFCILASNMKQEKVEPFFNNLRERLAQNKISTDSGEIAFTVSIGVTSLLADSLEATINRADTLLYEAKQKGRNRVSVDPL